MNKKDLATIIFNDLIDDYLIDDDMAINKKDEIIEIFKNGDPGQKSKIKTIMTGLDPTKASKYNEALN